MTKEYTLFYFFRIAFLLFALFECRTDFGTNTFLLDFFFGFSVLVLNLHLVRGSKSHVNLFAFINFKISGFASIRNYILTSGIIPTFTFFVIAANPV